MRILQQTVPDQEQSDHAQEPPAPEFGGGAQAAAEDRLGRGLRRALSDKDSRRHRRHCSAGIGVPPAGDIDGRTRVAAVSVAGVLEFSAVAGVYRRSRRCQRSPVAAAIYRTIVRSSLRSRCQRARVV